MERTKLSWPKVPKLEVIAERLPQIFPDGTENRNYVTREMAARTLYVMFYAGAIDGQERWIRPSQVTDMSDEQAVLLSDEERNAWVEQALSSKKERPATLGTLRTRESPSGMRLYGMGSSLWGRFWRELVCQSLRHYQNMR